MPSQYIFDIAYAIHTYFKGESVTTLLNMPFEEFMDLAIYCINALNEQKEYDCADDYVNNYTIPAKTSIKNGGWC